MQLEMDIQVEDKRPLCQLPSERLEDNWQSGLLSATNQRLSGVRLPAGRKWLLLRKFGLYKILFCFWAFVHESILFFAHPPFVWAPHPTPSSPALLRNIPFRPDLRHCNINHTILAIAISCKGQAAIG